MSIRTAKRQIARTRMKALGFERVNRTMGVDRGHGGKIWRRVLTGDLAEKANVALCGRKNRRAK